MIVVGCVVIMFGFAAIKVSGVSVLEEPELVATDTNNEFKSILVVLELSLAFVFGTFLTLGSLFAVAYFFVASRIHDACSRYLGVVLQPLVMWYRLKTLSFVTRFELIFQVECQCLQPLLRFR